jgi:hypothetical protein
MSKFEERNEAVAFISTAIGDWFDAPEQAEVVASACVDAFIKVEYPQFTPGTFGFMVPRMLWVIRDDDIKLSEAFFKAVAAAAGANFFVASIPAAAVVGLLAAVYGVFNAVRKKGVSLTKEQCRLLIALHREEAPVSVVQLAKLLMLSPEEAKAQLEGLTKLRCGDGSVVAVVAQDGQGLWAAAGI